MGKLDGHVCIVTGSGAGLGRGIALRVGSEGAAVIAADLNLSSAEATAEAIRAAGGRALALQCDVTSEASVAAMVAAGATHFGKVDLLCNNVGASIEARGVIRIEDLTEDQWNFIHNINLKSVFFSCKHVIPEMLKCGGGSIVNITSAAAIHPNFGAAYAAAKAGIIGFSKSVAVQYADYNIRCNTIAPGAMQTPGGASSKGEGIFKDREKVRERLLQRFGTPDDIGAAAVFLLSDDAAYITAANLAVDGGALMIVPSIPKREK